ncbi:MAG: OmpP1/FadL family transporter [Verrucomicrobiota bacterium]
MKNKLFLFVLALAWSGAPAIPSATGGGYKIPDQSTRAMGMMDAFVAGADDASSVYYNPAGLAHILNPEMIGNLYVSHTELEWDSSTAPDETSDNKHYLIPTAYAAMPAPNRDDLTLGLGIYSPYGLGTEWNTVDSPTNAALGAFGEIVVINVTPSAGWRVSERLRLGAGLDLAWSSVEQRRSGPPTRMSLDGDGTGIGYNLGLQYDFTPTCTLGLAYRSKMSVEYEGDAEIQPPLPFPPYSGGAETEIEFPASATVALSLKPTTRLRLELAASWEDWSINEQTVVHLDPPAGPIVEDNDWNSSWVLMLGAEYELNEKITLRSGYGYNEQPSPSATATPLLPQDDLHALSVGLGYHVSEQLTLDTALLMSHSNDKKRIDATPAGEHSHFGYALSFGVRYRF